MTPIKGVSDPRVVVALGGNALGNSPAEQLDNLRVAVKALVGLIADGYEIVVSHGNGPQVGLISRVFDQGVEQGIAPVGFDLPECTAMSQGYIGYHLQQCLARELSEQGMPWHVASVVTQMVVDAEDPGFANPTKPVGSFFSEEEARAQMDADPTLVMREDSGRGWRRMVASPAPQRIVEQDSVLNLLDHEFVVVACGGGGVPVVSDGGKGFQGVPAVIDKDLSSSLLAQSVDAQVLVILTAVDRVAINFGTPEQEDLAQMTVADAERYMAEGQFAPGSMLPKVQAAVDFVKSGPQRNAVICDLQKAGEALKGTTGTVIRAN